MIASHYDEFATRIATFAKNQGLYAMSAANEPDFASCGSTIGPPCNGDYVTMVYTANEMVKFVKVLGPKLKANGVKLMAPEPSEWIHLWSNASATGSTISTHPNSSDPLGCGCFSNSPTTTGCASKCSTGDGYDYGHWLAKDATAWAAVDILATHEYDSQKAEPWPADVDGGKRSKEIWETEVSGVMYWPEQGPSSDINNGIVVAGWIHSALVVGEASAWLYWWYKPTGNDNEGIVLSSGAITKRYYTIGNYSKFVRPGYVMVDVTGNSNANVLLSAFSGTDATVVVAINKSTSAVTHADHDRRGHGGAHFVHAERDLVQRQPEGRHRGHRSPAARSRRRWAPRASRRSSASSAGRARRPPPNGGPQRGLCVGGGRAAGLSHRDRR